MTTAGPFRLYGTNLVRSCVENGTDYCDITGEIDWVREIIDLYGVQARITGARIIFCSGADSIPWDLSTFLMQQKLKEKGEELIKTEHFNDGMGGMSGGTLKTLLMKIDGQVEKKVQRLKFDPLLAQYSSSGDFIKSENKTKAVLDKCPKKVSRIPGWTILSPIGFGNFRIISRSNALLNYQNGFIYREALITPYFINAFNALFGMILLGTIIMLKPLRWIFFKIGFLPSPGQGPDMEKLKKSYLIIEGFGVGSSGSVVNLKTSFNKDVGYVDTARMLVESGLCFVFEEGEIENKGGMFTPASCFGNSLRRRLEDTGTEFEFK